MEEKVTNVMNIRLEDMPNLEHKFNLQQRRAATMIRQVVNERANQNLYNLKSTVFKALHTYSIRSKKHDRSLNMLLRHFRKYQLFHAFRKVNL